MKIQPQTVITAFRALAVALVESETTHELLARLAQSLKERFGLLHANLVMQEGTFGLASGEHFGLNFAKEGPMRWERLDSLGPELADSFSAEIVSEEEMARRFPEQDSSCATEKGISHLRIRVLYRQRFVGFFCFERKAEEATGELSLQIAALMEIFGAVVLDIVEQRTARRREYDFLVRQNESLKSRLEPVSAGLIGESDAMHEVYGQIRQVAPTDATVLVRGNSGTGKELVARSLVALSPRKDRPFLTVNCAALPETLIESELFGHEKGAFTGAIERRIGRAEAADGGTLFLDEIGDLTPATQVKLLRFLQEKTFSRVGSNAEIRSDVRFIAATSRNLEELMEKKLFREDLYYRLNIFTIQMPDLADRRGDILLLARSFAEKFNAKYGKSVRHLSPDLTAALLDWKWPGNVRELENCIERAVLTSSDDTIRVQNLPPPMRPAGWDAGRGGEGGPSSGGADDAAQGRTLDEIVDAYRRKVVEEALAKAGGNKSAAARALGITPRMMYYEMSRRSGAGL